MITAYYRLVQFSEEKRIANKIRSKNRINCIQASFIGDEYRGLMKFINSKGQLHFYKTLTEEVVKAHTLRRGEIALTNSDHFTSIFIPDMECKQFGFGDFGKDAFLFLVNEDFTEFEMFVCPNLRNYSKSLYHKLIDGDFDLIIERLRSNAKTFYNYL